jgi:hypothetical protein
MPDGSELKTSGFADDTSMYLRNTESMKWAKHALDMYCAASDASLNHDKTVGVMLGNTPQWQQHHLRVDTWVQPGDCERYLGAHFGNADKVLAKWNKVIGAMKSRAAKWAMRELSLYGRCLVHKASIASCLWFMCSVMDTPVHAQQEMKKIMDQIIWREGAHLVAHQVCCMTQALGGFKKMDTDTQLQARRASWGARYLDPQAPGRWKSIVWQWLRESGMTSSIWVAGHSRGALNAIQSSHLPRFWQECIKAMWDLRPVRIPHSDPHRCDVHTHMFHTVTIVDYCTVQYNRTQWVGLSEFTVKLAYWCIVRHKWGNPVPKGQTNWVQRGVQAEWPVAWSNIRSPVISKKQAERSYKLMHCVGPASSRLCGLSDCSCGSTRTNMWHGIFECPAAMRAWRAVEAWWYKLGGTSDITHPIHKLTVVSTYRGGEVQVDVWRLLCACMIDCLWVGWTGWVHNHKEINIPQVLLQWEKSVHERIRMQWIRALRITSDYSRHIDYVPGCIWSKPRIDHKGKFRQTWEGPLGRIGIGNEWTPNQLF